VEKQLAAEKIPVLPEQTDANRCTQYRNLEPASIDKSELDTQADCGMKLI